MADEQMQIRPELIRQDSLCFDRKNPRLAESSINQDSTDNAIIRVLWREMAADELALSIAHNSFFPYEPLFASNESGKLIVVEGNRRLAAVRVLLDDALRQEVKADHVPLLSDEQKDQLRFLPVVIEDRQKLWEFIGFKHVNGPQSWSSYSKARFIAKVHRDQGVTLEQIAETIGDQHSTVERLFRGIVVLEQAERLKLFGTGDHYRGRFAFSHLYTALDKKGFQSFLGLSAVENWQDDPVPPEFTSNLGQVMEWLYGSKQNHTPPVIRSQNPDLKNLDKVLSSPSAVAALKSGESLEVALDISRGDEDVLLESLIIAKTSLQKGLGVVLTARQVTPSMTQTAREARDISGKLYEELKERTTQPKLNL